METKKVRAVAESRGPAEPTQAQAQAQAHPLVAVHTDEDLQQVVGSIFLQRLDTVEDVTIGLSAQ